MIKQNNTSLFSLFFVLFLSTLGFGGVVLHQSFTELMNHRRWVDHTHTVISKTEEFLYVLKEGESAFRGFLLSGQEIYLSPYRNAISVMPEQVRQIKQFVSDNPIQSERFAIIEMKLAERIALFEKLVVMRRQKQSDAVHEWVIGGEGRAKMEEIRSVSESVLKVEKALLADRGESAAKSEVLLKSLLTAFVVATFVLSSVAFFLLRRNFKKQHEESWIQSAQVELSKTLQQLKSFEDIGNTVLAHFAKLIELKAAVFFVYERGTLQSLAAYGVLNAESQVTSLKSAIAIDALKSGSIVKISTKDFQSIRVNSVFGDAIPKYLFAMPIRSEDEVVGVIEIGHSRQLRADELKLIERILPIIGSAVITERARRRVQELLEETQMQAEELASQQEELRVSNEELQKQTKDLSLSRDRLQSQQEELVQINEELEEQAKALERQRQELSEKNADLEESKSEIEHKVEELATASRYKSEFLANMSHELRTPLNSILILATLLTENRDERLTDKEIEFAQSIRSAGSDLLNLINDILDLSKVEAGKLEINLEPVDLAEVFAEQHAVFEPVAGQKKLKLAIDEPSAEIKTLVTDQKRVEQVLKNFISNAIKFTESGEVRLSAQKVGEEVSIEVSDTGIGVAPEKQERIFEAFTQADGSTSRKFGGTGLGLTISRQLASLLGGRIELRSQIGKGSVFSLILPIVPTAALELPLSTKSYVENPFRSSNNTTVPAAIVKPNEGSSQRTEFIPDDRSLIVKDDKVLMVVEDDIQFARLLVKFGRDAHFRVLANADIQSAEQDLEWCLPSAIILDVKLPDSSGLVLLEKLKSSVRTRHIPVHLISGLDYSEAALKLGAVGYLKKPVEANELRKVLSKMETVVSHSIRNVLVVEDEKLQSDHIRSLISFANVSVDVAENAKQAIEKLRKNTYECMILDLRLPDMSGLELLETLHNDNIPSLPPVIVYTAKDLLPDEESRIRKYSETIILKGAKSPERLLDEVTLFLHRVVTDLSSEQQTMLKHLRDQEKIFENKTILLVDDDLRNVFALASALEARGLGIKVARNGLEAIDMASHDKTIDLVLMDIMMPGIDGFEAIRRIRLVPHLRRLPIIALTAKAMKGDQDKCFEAGANDYLSKPINLDRLVSVLKVWLPKSDGI